MANMLAGHIMIVLLFSATNLDRLLVIFLQAYIFALLAAVYIDLSLHADSH